MAAKFRKIDPRIWKDEKFRKLDQLGKLVALYVLTAQANRIGLFHFSPAMAAEELEMSSQTFDERFEKVCRTMSWDYDAGSRTLYLPKWWKYNHAENPNVLKANLGDLHDLPQTPLLTRFCENVEHLKKELHQTFKECVANVALNVSPSVPHQEQEQKQEQVQDQEQSAAASRDVLTTDPPEMRPPRKEPSGSHQQFIDTFTDQWQQNYVGQKYPFVPGKDGAAAKIILRSIGEDPNKWNEVLRRYFADSSDFYRGHSLAKLSSQLTRFLTDPTHKGGTSYGRPPTQQWNGRFEGHRA